MAEPTNFNPLAIRRALGSTTWKPPMPFGPDGWKFLNRNGVTSIIVSCSPQDDGNEWVHASIAHSLSMPTYDDLKMLQRVVFDGGWAYQVFAPPSDHVNIHNYALHLFGRLDGKPALPDFTHGMGSI